MVANVLKGLSYRRPAVKCTAKTPTNSISVPAFRSAAYSVNPLASDFDLPAYVVIDAVVQNEENLVDDFILCSTMSDDIIR